ncbi:MAG TPA: YtxH domain-containing protein [Longimicrobiales bacterium]|nr:YtxH domain-containing protein [Longimicrobiales bacterium]
MAHHDDVPYVIIERRSGGATAFLWGALMGAGAALLLAPRTGRETRDEIRSGALRLRDRAEDAVRNVSDQVTGAIGGVRDEVEDRLDRARDAFEAGRAAARETRGEMEARVREVRAGVRGGVSAARGDTGTSVITPDDVDADTDSELGV